jgi:hypothetical protein
MDTDQVSPRLVLRPELGDAPARIGRVNLLHAAGEEDHVECGSIFAIGELVVDLGDAPHLLRASLIIDLICGGEPAEPRAAIVILFHQARSSPAFV